MNTNAALHPEQSFFFESAGCELYGLLGTPASVSNLREGVIFCAPAPHEVKKFHWATRQMAQRLQLAGYHTLRFDYFATGDSAGESRDYNLDLCRINIRDAIAYLKSSGLIRRVSIVATRLACPLVLQAVQEERVRKLILIDPVLDGATYLAEAELMQEAMLQEHLRSSPHYPRKALQGQLLGYPHHAYLSWQLQQLQTFPDNVKAKEVAIMSSQGSSDPSPLVQHLKAQVEETRVMNVSDNLRWGHARALQFQDFPNQLLRTVVDSIRGLV
jgi:pimeloyl-ACP methyl ester carboxylesterase